LLPVRAGSAVPDLSVGWTPLAGARALARHIGIRTLFLKDDGRNATGSMKDRASAVGVMKAREAQRKIIACASTGNSVASW
jgi:threonine synthase